MVLESLDKESVPFLRELLRDESYKDRWNQIALMIAMLSEKDDKESVIAILNYIRRPNTWPSDDRYSIIGDTVKKGATLKNLGLFDSSLVGETLRNAFTEEGAEKLIRPWADTQGTVDPLQLAMITRSWAAKGLVLTRDPVNVALVSESYEALAHTMLSSEYKKREASPELLLDVERHLAFCEGMADNEMLSEMGVEGFLRLRDDGHAFSSEKSRVLTKYMGEWFDDYRMVLSSCPICGKLAE
jgi:hypothetical protein